jgi:hypothetical protein
MRKVLGTAIVAALLALAPAAPALAAANPSGTGQPSQECGEEGATSMPSGFTTGGFENAEARYAGSDGTPSLMNGSGNAVSQYDVACFQVTSSGR